MNYSKLDSPLSSEEHTPFQSTAATSVLASPLGSPKGVPHVLDLPNLKTKPSAQVLLTTLAMFSQSSDVKNFDAVADENATMFNAAPGTGFFRWLTNVVGSPLDWIENEQDQDDIWSQASLRMAERCGRTAAPKMTRQISVDNLKEAVYRQRAILPQDQPPITLEEPALTEDSLGLKTWGSSLVLANRFAREVSDILVDPVLELGSGTGLCGIVAGRLGYNVTLTDLPEIVENLKVNVERNKISNDGVSVEVLDWLNPASFNGGPFNSIIASDPVYQSDQPGMISKVISQFLVRSETAHLCLQLPLRAKFEDVRNLLKNELQEAGLEIVRTEEEEGQDDFGKMVYAWSLWKWRKEFIE